MSKLLSCLMTLLCSHLLMAQNMGVGTINPQDKLDVNGNLRATGVRVTNSNYLEMGFNTTGKETNAGRFCYGCFGEPHLLHIVGGGTRIDLIDRSIKLWTEGGMRVVGSIFPEYNSSFSLGRNGGAWRSVAADTVVANVFTSTVGAIMLKAKTGLKFVLAQSGTGTEFMEIGADAIIPYSLPSYLGTSAKPWYQAFAMDGFYTTSDSAAKTNIQNINNGIYVVKQLHPVTYQLKQSTQHNCKQGFLAQELLQIAPYAVHVPKDGGPLAVDYASLIPVLTKAVQELTQQVEALQQEVKALKNK